MTPLQRHILAKGELIKTAELHTFGISRTGIERALADGEIQRIRQSWYARPDLPPDQARAARIGGQLACGSAAKTLGLWEPLIPGFHVCVEPDARGLRSPTSDRTRLQGVPGVAVHWTGIDPAGTRTVVSVGGCLRQLKRVTNVVGEVLDLGFLVVVREDHRVALVLEALDLGLELGVV